MKWIGLIIILSAFIIACIVEGKNKIKYPIICFLVISSALGGIFFLDGENKEHPSALDVYRHKTTLKVTYIDGEPSDTVVIFKNVKEGAK